MKPRNLQNHTFFTTSTLGSAERYRFGFNGQESENEIWGEGNTYSAEYWMYDARLGRRWNLDPVDQISVSNYATFANNPIFFIDIEGDVIKIHYKDENGESQYYTYTPGIKPTVSNQFVQQVHDAVSYVMKVDPNNTFQNLHEHQDVILINEIKDDKNCATFDFNQDESKVINVIINWNPELAYLVNGDEAMATVI